MYPEQDIASSRARDFVLNLDELQDMLKEEIAKAQRQYQPSANSCRQQPLDFQVGQLVFVRSQYFQMTRPSKKLSKKYLGPYEIIAQPSPQSFTLCLLDIMRAAHPVFHVSMLEPATPNTFQQRSEPLLAPVIIDGEPEYEISKIVDSKIDCQRACKLLYKVIWLGYEDTDNDSEWLPATELEHAKELLNDFHLKYLSKLGPLRPWIISIPFSQLCFSAFTPLQKKKNYPWVFIHIPECSFICTDLLICIPLRSFRCNLILVFKSSFRCKTWVLVFLYSFPCGRRLLVFLLHHLSSLTSIFCHRKNNIYQTKKITSFPFQQSMWLKKSYHHLLPHPPFHSPLPVL